MAKFDYRTELKNLNLEQAKNRLKKYETDLTKWLDMANIKKQFPSQEIENITKRIDYLKFNFNI